MVDEAKLCSPLCSTFEALVVWHWVTSCHGEALGPFCWPMSTAGITVFEHLIDLLSILLRCNGFTRIQKVVVDQMGSSHQIVTMTFFLVQVWLWDALWCFFSVQPLSWLYYKIHFSSHITVQYKNGLLLHRIREDISKWWFFFICITHLSSFFTFPICFKCWMTIEWSMLSSSATSPVVVRGSASMILAVGHCQLPMASHCAHLLGKTSRTITGHTFVSSSWAKCTVDVANCLHYFMTHFELEKENSSNLLSNIVSLV